MSNIEINPYQIIEELEYFYTSDSVKNERVIEVPDNIKEKKKGTIEVQGQCMVSGADRSGHGYSKS